MKTVRRLLLGLAMLLAVLGAGVASASTTTSGKATFVGTLAEDSTGGVYHARLRGCASTAPAVPT
jgi:hypothetical protein